MDIVWAFLIGFVLGLVFSPLGVFQKLTSYLPWSK